MIEGIEILKSLGPLFKEAEEKGLWFRSYHEGIWFHPNELKQQHEEGKYIWGPSNWVLEHPESEIKSLRKQQDFLEKRIKSFQHRIDKFRIIS